MQGLHCYVLGVALDWAAVPADSDLRKIENIFFPEDICEIPGSVPPEEPVSAKAITSDSLVPEDEEVQPPAKDKSPEDTLTIRDVVTQAKEVVPEPKVGGDQPEAGILVKRSTQDKA